MFIKRTVDCTELATWGVGPSAMFASALLTARNWLGEAVGPSAMFMRLDVGSGLRRNLKSYATLLNRNESLTCRSLTDRVDLPQPKKKQ